MIEIVTKHDIDDILTNPSEYVDETQDLVLLKIHPDTLVMIGQDESTKEYYLCVEDNETTRDYYPKESLMKTFNEITRRNLYEN